MAIEVFVPKPWGKIRVEADEMYVGEGGTLVLRNYTGQVVAAYARHGWNHARIVTVEKQ